MQLVGEITLDSVKQVVTELEQGTLDTIFLCTDGGRVEAALAIYDLIVNQGITVIGTGLVASSGLIILLGGDKRALTPNTRLMSHPISISGASVEAEGAHVQELTDLSNILKSMFAKRTGMGKKRANELLSKTAYLNAKQAIELGFAHGYVEMVKKEAA